MRESTATLDPLVALVRQQLLAGTDGLASRELAAYVAGWGAALDLIERTDLTVPASEPELHATVAEIVRRVRVAQHLALGDDDGD